MSDADITPEELDEIQRWAKSHEHNDESTTVAGTYLRLIAAVRARDAELTQWRKRWCAENENLEAVSASLTDRAALAEARAAKLRETLRAVIENHDGYAFNCGNDQSYVGQWIEEVRAALATDEREGID